MAANSLPSPEYLRQCFDYDPDTGLLRWRTRPLDHFADRNICYCWNARFAGKLTGHPDRKGHIRISINRRSYGVHRIIWCLMTGYDSPLEIDHRNCAAGDNRWENLREATRVQNQGNTRARRNNKLGIKGVFRDSRSGKFCAQISINWKSTHLGMFNTAEEAKKAYDIAAQKRYGAFARS